MTRRMLATAVAAFLATQLAAVTVGPDWCVAYPDTGSKDINRVLRVAAEEVRDDINEATGLKLKSVPAAKAKSPAIFIGAEFARKSGFDLSGLKWYDNVVAEKDGSIYCFGNDRTGRDPEKVGRVGWWQCVLPSVKAATRFLETAAGVRFLMPGEVGKEVPKRSEISVADGSFAKESPMLIYGSGRSNNDRALIYLISNGIWGMGSFKSYGGHSYDSACRPSKYINDHPEYIGMKDGKRVLNKTDGLTPLCISNSEVEELMIDELKRQFDMGADVCQLGQHDGWAVCECDKCREMYGTGDDWCEKFWLFHRHIAERILEERPGKIVHIMSYAATFHPPKSFKVFPENVMIELCSYSEETFKEWEGYTVPQGFTVYVYNWGAYTRPGFVARRSFAFLAQQVKRFRDNNVKGVYRCETNGDLPGTEGPGYYIFNNLLLDGTKNVSALLADYCSAAFGPAAALMREFYETQNRRLNMFCLIERGYPDGIAEGLDRYLNAGPRKSLDLHGWIFSPDTTALMEERLSRAEKMDGLSPKQRKRLELVRLEFDYAKNMGAISTLYAAYTLRPTKESLAPLLDEVEKRNAYLDRLFANNRSIDGWPEISPLFGWQYNRKKMDVNGRLGANIGAPLTWPVADIRRSGTLPGVKVRTRNAAKVGTPPTFVDFDLKGGWDELGGMAMEKVPTKSRFKVVYDDANMYVLTESDLAADVKPKTFSRDGNIWEDDSVDVMIAPGNTKDVFFHFIYGVDAESRYDDATGLITDPLDPGYGKADVTWNGSGWNTRSRREGGKWRSIATFPYSDFGVARPNPGDRWFVNVGHLFKTGDKRRGAICMLWSPNVESTTFVAPNAMGQLIFK